MKLCVTLFTLNKDKDRSVGDRVIGRTADIAGIHSRVICHGRWYVKDTLHHPVCRGISNRDVRSVSGPTQYDRAVMSPRDGRQGIA